MIRSFSRCFGASTMLLALVSLTGCIETEQYQTTLTIMPDGSGKLFFEFVFKQNVDAAIAQAFAKETEQSINWGVALGREKLPKGVGVVSCEVCKVNGKDGMRMTYYFEDFGVVAGGADSKIAFKELGEGFVLDFPATPAPSVRIPRVKGEEPRFQMRFTLPGDIKAAEGATGIDGRTATFLSDTAPTPFVAENVERHGQIPAAKVLPESPRVRIVCGPSRISKEEVAAFRAEMEAAKAAWDKQRKLIREQAPDILLAAAKNRIKTSERKQAEADLLAVAIQFPDTPEAVEARKLRHDLLLVMKQEDETADAMLKKAKSQWSGGGAGSRAAARRTLESLLKAYPYTPAAEEARQLTILWNPKPVRGGRK